MKNQTVETTQKRLRILGDDEITDLYARPHFTPEERVHFFALSQPETELLQELRSVHSQAYFILQLGYFKAKQLFFTFTPAEVQADLAYILERYFPQAPLESPSGVNKRTNLRQRQHLAVKARQAARVSSKPIYVLRALLQYLAEHRIVAPGYSFLQDTVGQALTYEQDRLVAVVGTYLPDAEREALHHLLDDAQGLYQITLLNTTTAVTAVGRSRNCQAD
jgi:hypothetical protein